MPRKTGPAAPAHRPRLLPTGRKRNLYIGDESIAIALAISPTSYSEGIRIALDYYAAKHNIAISEQPNDN